MIFLNTVGIDISKLTFDAVIYNSSHYKRFSNGSIGFKKLLEWVKKMSDTSFDQILFCFEHCGRYSLNLSCYLTEKEIKFAVKSGLEIKKSIGLQRGKSDKVDAQYIARYAYEKRDKIKLYVLPSQAIRQLHTLLSLRKKLVRQRAGYYASLKEDKRILKRKEHCLLFKTQEGLITQFSKRINAVEKEMLLMIKNNTVLKNQYELLNSIPGIGFVIAINLLVYTNSFIKFENWRQFSCYIGTAPFEYSSGTSVKKRTRVNPFGHRQLKSIINMGATTAIQHDPEIKDYYKSRIKNGGSKMAALNIIRNKLIARAFAVIRRNSPYVPLYKHLT